MEQKFELAGKTFSLVKLDAFKQFHVVRRVGPILTQLLPSLALLKDVGDSKSDSKKLEQITVIATPILDGLSKLSDADADFVLHTLLSCVEVQQAGGNWAKLSMNGILMINDLELPVLLQVAAKSFTYNLSGFFAALPQ